MSPPPSTRLRSTSPRPRSTSPPASSPRPSSPASPAADPPTTSSSSPSSNDSPPTGHHPLLPTIVIGCKLLVHKRGDGPRKAEVLSIRGSLSQANLDFYVHYADFNKRLDEWVPATALCLDSGNVEYPRASAAGGGAGGAAGSKGGSVTKKGSRASQKGGSASAASGSSSSKGHQSKGKGAGESLAKAATIAAAQQRTAAKNVSKTSAMDDDTASMGSQTATDLDSTLLADGSSSQPGSPGTSRPSTPTPFASGGSGKGKENETPSTAGPPGTFSKADEREKLRVGGSMTQCVSEISRVKNLNKLVMGKHIVEPWYFSPYPQEVAHLDTLWLCEFCLGYFVSARSLERHRTKCTLTHPPGNEIYRKDNISFFEIDGRRQKQYCRNLCLVSKCFLDHKTLYYDVDPFMFYLMTVSDEHGSHLVGYFSKEKESAEGYNLACILTLPQHQRKGYGRLLIQFSYELSKVEGKPGSPEKPLSDLGLLSYRAYWTEVLVDHLVHRSDCTIDDLARETCILVKDIMDTLVALNAVRYYKGSYVIVLSKACLEAQERSKRKNKVSIDPKCLEWRPPSWVGKEKYLN